MYYVLQSLLEEHVFDPILISRRYRFYYWKIFLPHIFKIFILTEMYRLLLHRYSIYLFFVNGISKLSYLDTKILYFIY